MARYIKAGTPTTIGEIDSNLEAIEVAIADMLSRKGDAPNQMNAPLDMNSYGIRNLPIPTYDSDPVRLKDLRNAEVGVFVGNTRSFDSVAALASSTLTAGEVVKTTGYYSTIPTHSEAQTGGAYYKILTQVEHGSAGDGVISHTLTNGNVAVIIPDNGELLASQCGAIMDGSTGAIGSSIAANYLYPSRYYNNTLSPIHQPTSGSERPFSETDTIDLVAVQAGIWYASLNGYRFLIDGPSVVLSNCVVMMAGDDCNISGLGMATTNIYNPNSDTTNNTTRFLTTQANQNCLFLYYRGDGEPKTFGNIKLLGKVNYNSASTTDFRCVSLLNTNGWYPNNLWMSSASGGIVMETSCSDIHLGFVVSEFLFTDSIRADITCDWNMMNGGNLWASQTTTSANGINSASKVAISNVRFNGFKGRAVIGGDGSTINGGEFYNQGAGSLGAISLGANSELNGVNVISASSNAGTVILGSNSRVIGGSYGNNTEHPVFDFIATSAGLNKNSKLIGVTVIKSSTSTASTNVAVQDQIPGVSFVGASSKLKISNCHFEGDKALISGCEDGLIDNSNTFSNTDNELQSPDGSFKKSFNGTAFANSTTTLLTVDKVDYYGGGITADISGILSLVAAYNCQINAIYVWGTSVPSITEVSNIELGGSTSAFLTVQVVAVGNSIALQIVNSSANNFSYICNTSLSGATRANVSIA